MNLGPLPPRRLHACLVSFFRSKNPDPSPPCLRILNRLRPNRTRINPPSNRPIPPRQRTRFTTIQPQFRRKNGLNSKKLHHCRFFISFLLALCYKLELYWSVTVTVCLSLQYFRRIGGPEHLDSFDWMVGACSTDCWEVYLLYFGMGSLFLKAFCFIIVGIF